MDFDAHNCFPPCYEATTHEVRRWFFWDKVQCWAHGGIFLWFYSALFLTIIFYPFDVTNHSRSEGKWAHRCCNRRRVFPFWPFVSFHSRSFFPGHIWSRAYCMSGSDLDCDIVPCRNFFIYACPYPHYILYLISIKQQLILPAIMPIHLSLQ